MPNDIREQDRLRLLAEIDQDLSEWREICTNVLKERGEREISVPYWRRLLRRCWREETQNVVPAQLMDTALHIGLLQIAKFLTEREE